MSGVDSSRPRFRFRILLLEGVNFLVGVLIGELLHGTKIHTSNYLDLSSKISLVLVLSYTGPIDKQTRTTVVRTFNYITHNNQ